MSTAVRTIFTSIIMNNRFNLKTHRLLIYLRTRPKYQVNKAIISKNKFNNNPLIERIKLL